MKKKSVRKRVAKALKKFIRGNPGGIAKVTGDWYILPGSSQRTFRKASTARKAAQTLANRSGKPVEIMKGHGYSEAWYYATIEPKRGNPGGPGADYVVYPDSVGISSLKKARAYAKRRSKQEPATEFRVENIYTNKVVARYKSGRTNPAGRSVALRNFTGTITRLRNGQVAIQGRRK